MSRRADVLEALRVGAAGGCAVSGEGLAADLGVSRAAIAKHIAALRAVGYEIMAAPGEGYVLLSAPDLPLPGEVVPLIDSAFWNRFEGGGETGSTNDDAKALARAGAPEGTVVLASAQGAGRGRLGRAWFSPSGGVYLSAVLRPPLAPSDTAPLALVVALGIANGLEQLGVSTQLKWPNDVLCDDGKLAGVLLEMSAEADGLEWVVAGVGLNVRRPDDADAFPGAAYVGDLAPGASLAGVAAAVLDGLADAYERFCAVGFAALRAGYVERLAGIGAQATVSDATGTVCAEGTIADVDAGGRLVLDGAAGRQRVSAGEVTLRRN